ncbi:MAG: ABC transporter substrate-binding protein [Thermomicrobiales bacterium]
MHTITLPSNASSRPALTDWTTAEVAELVNALTRRGFVATAAAVAAMGGIGIAGAQTPAATPGDAGSGSRTVESVNGPIVVPANPTRVVCIDTYSLAALIDAGLVPVGVPELDLDSFIAPYKEALTVLPTIGTFQGIDVEQIKVLQPEVILSINAPWATDIYDQLAQIAPTVLLDYAVPNAWQVLSDQFATAVGREADLATVKQAYAERTAAVKSTWADALATLRWAVAIGWGAADNQFALYYPDSAPGVILTDCGAQFIAAAVGKTGTSEQFSYERLSLLEDADVLLTYGTRDGEPEEQTQAMIDQPLFQALKVAQEEHVFALSNVIPSSYGAAILFVGSVEAIIREVTGAATPVASPAA